MWNQVLRKSKHSLLDDASTRQIDHGYGNVIYFHNHIETLINNVMWSCNKKNQPTFERFNRHLAR